jgi:methylmalonyl-CoA mutase
VKEIYIFAVKQHVFASLGEISDACEVLQDVITTLELYQRVFIKTKNDADFQKACELTAKFAKKEGRQPRIMIAKMADDTTVC